jgi:hypothetical protein
MAGILQKRTWFELSLCMQVPADGLAGLADVAGAADVAPSSPGLAQPARCVSVKQLTPAFATSSRTAVEQQ